MKRIILVLVSLVAGLHGFSQGLQFEKAEYVARREKLMKECPDGIILVMGASARPDYYPFIQNNNFLYLCGIELADAFIAIDPVKKETVLFATVNNWYLRETGIPEDLITNPLAYAGITKILPTKDLHTYLTSSTPSTNSTNSTNSTKIYTCFLPEELPRECSGEKAGSLNNTLTRNPWDGRLTKEMQFVEQLKKQIPGAEVKDCSKQIHSLRTIKSPAEIALMREAGKIGVEAHKAVMKATKPGVKEYELAALFEYTCKRLGAEELAYYTIICTAENHTDLHHHGYRRTLEDGDFLVVDGGPDLHNYDIDITTSFPANGKFTPRQKEIYEACNAVHEACMKVYRPGITTQQCNKEVAEVLEKLGFDTKSELIRNFGAGFGHYVGMAVHDVGGSPKVLEPGMIFANEPLAVFAKENLGVRIEDTILITENGCENLTKGIPRTVEEIERFMKK